MIASVDGIMGASMFVPTHERPIEQCAALQYVQSSVTPIFS